MSGNVEDVIGEPIGVVSAAQFGEANGREIIQEEQRGMRTGRSARCQRRFSARLIGRGGRDLPNPGANRLPTVDRSFDCLTEFLGSRRRKQEDKRQGQPHPSKSGTAAALSARPQLHIRKLRSSFREVKFDVMSACILLFVTKSGAWLGRRPPVFSSSRL